MGNILETIAGKITVIKKIIMRPKSEKKKPGTLLRKKKK